MSNESQHTPGPWHVEDIRPDATENIAVFNPLLGVCTDGDDAVAICGRRNEEFVQANARLIAAAPELLEALEDLLAGWELMISQYGYDPVQEPSDSLNMKARAAIAKAKGE